MQALNVFVSHTHTQTGVEVFPSSTMLSVNESIGHVNVCATMIGLTERPVDIIMTTTDGTAKSQYMTLSSSPTVSYVTHFLIM